MIWLTKAAEQDHANSQLVLGTLFQDGNGVIQDFGLAASWYERAGNNGEHTAYAFRALISVGGQIGDVDYEDGLNWALKGAIQDCKFCQMVAAGILLERAPPDLVEGHKWANLASISNNEDIAKQSTEMRSLAESSMNSAQIADAQQRARNWQPISVEQADSPASSNPLARVNTR